MSTPVTSRNWDDELCVLVHVDGSLASIGEELIDFRGDGGTILAGGAAPHKEASTGKVYTRDALDTFQESVYYPSVFNLKWRPVQEGEDVSPR